MTHARKPDARKRSARRACSRVGPRRQRGIALVLALWLTIMLTVIASGFVFSMRNEAMAARNSLVLGQARAAADGAVERTVYELSRPRTKDAWTSDGRVHAWQDGDIRLTVAAVDEAARIDINAASEVLLRNLFINIGGAEPELANQLTDAVQDWRDPDDLRRANGAEAQDYLSAGRNYGPSNAPFETVAELSRVMGMTPAIFAKIAGTLTVHSRQPGINTTTAPREVLLALPNTTPEAVDAYIVTRREALDAGMPVPPFAPAQGFGAGAVPVWRIHAEANTADGVTFVREAVVRPSPDPRRPLIVLLWQDGISAGTPGMVADGKTDATGKAPSNTPNQNGRS